MKRIITATLIAASLTGLAAVAAACGHKAKSENTTPKMDNGDGGSKYGGTTAPEGNPCGSAKGDPCGGGE